MTCPQISCGTAISVPTEAAVVDGDDASTVELADEEAFAVVCELRSGVVRRRDRTAGFEAVPRHEAADDPHIVLGLAAQHA